jgi:hypothetical protein
MTHPVYPAPSRDLAARRAELAPATQDAFEAFSRQGFGEGALSDKDQAADRRGPRDAVPLLHPQPHSVIILEAAAARGESDAH